MMRVRLASLEDAVLLAELNCDVQRLHAEALPEIFTPADDLKPFVDEFRGRLLTNPDGRVYIAEVDGEAVGYVYAFWSRRLATPYTWARDTLVVDQISVRPAYQDCGIGRLLMQAVYDMAIELQVGRVRLNVLAFNDAAIGFYARLGFTMFSHEMVLDIKDAMRS